MLLRSVPSVKYGIIKEMTSRDNNLLNLTYLCQLAGVSRSGYYYWLDHESDRLKRAEQDKLDFNSILEAYKFRGYAKGARGIHMRLIRFDPPCVMNVKKIRRLCKKFGLKCPIRRANPYRRMAKAMQTSKVAPNILNREFKSHAPRQVLLTDITYIPRYNTHDKGVKYSYLSVIMDAHTEQILAYVLSTDINVDFVLETIKQLIDKHGHELKTDCLIHSDQGCHYTSTKFIDIVKDEKLRQSMSRRANCWDNAPQESLFGHMKQEIQLNPSTTHADLLRKVDDWVDYYNNHRPKWNLLKLTPNEYYEYLTNGVYPLPIELLPKQPPNKESTDNIDDN